MVGHSVGRRRVLRTLGSLQDMLVLVRRSRNAGVLRRRGRCSSSLLGRLSAMLPCPTTS